MKLEDVLAKVAGGDELSEDERDFLKNYKAPDVESAVKNRLDRERKKVEAERSEWQTQLDELKAQLESTHAGDDDAKKLTAKLERLQKQADEAAAQLKAERENHAKTQRKNALSQVPLPWLDSVSRSYRDLVLEEAFADLDTEDLGNMDAVQPIMERIVQQQESFMKASTRNGAGSGDDAARSRQKASPTDWTKPIDWKYVYETEGPEACKKKLDQMWAEEPAQK